VAEPATGNLTHLDWLESEAIHILREVAGQCAHPALLFSGGKDSIVLLRLARRRSARPLPVPAAARRYRAQFPRGDRVPRPRAAELGERLIVRTVEESIAQGTVGCARRPESRNKRLQSVTLLDAIAEHRLRRLHRRRAARRGEGAGQGTRVLASATNWGQWDPKNQRPELWNLYNARVHKGEHMRVFPISNWTETRRLAVHRARGLAVPSLYFAHPRPVVRRGGSAGADYAHDAGACRRDRRARFPCAFAPSAT
jgi:sulfate adenylyltransferase subunit 2